MTTARARAGRMAAAAALTTSPGAPDVTSAAIRTKPYRITLDLAPDDYKRLNNWLADAGRKVDPDTSRRLSLARALRAAIHVLTADDVVSDVVLDQLRRERAA